MNELALHNLKEGMIVAEDVMTRGGQRVLEKGKVLTKQSIMRLSFYNIKSVVVEDEAPAPEAPVAEKPTEPVAPAQPTPEKPAEPVAEKPVEPVTEKPAEAQKPQKVNTLRMQTSRKVQSFQIDHSIVLNTMKTSLEGYVNTGAPLDTQLLVSRVKDLFYSCKTALELFNMLHSMHTSDDSIYSHSLNVALICRQIGKWLKVDDATLDLYTLCGILHDIGKLKIPEEILNKPGKYTDEEFAKVRMHTQYGYDLLEPLPIDDHVKKAALSHHERCDGTGYPMGIPKAVTDNCAMIVAIADVYDAMTAARSYRAPLCPFQVIDKFEKEGLQKYNPKYILTFLSQVAGTYQNSRVLLSDGRSASIVMINQQNLSKPIVRLDDSTCIDLSTQSDLSIQAVL